MILANFIISLIIHRKILNTLKQYAIFQYMHYVFWN